MKKERIDRLLVERGDFDTRTQAQRAIMAGLVFVHTERVDKPGTQVPRDVPIEIKGQPHPYVSRGGLKLEHALKVFPLDVTQKIVLDIGASTGGFTDCALQHGAKKVYALDVGYGQLAWKLRQNPQVIVMERTHFRYVKKEAFTEGLPEVATIDVSFISLSHILSPLSSILLPDGEVMALVKPQFEAGKDQVGKGGIVKDPAVQRQVLSRFVQTAYQTGYDVQGLGLSPILGGKGNVEFLSYLIQRKPVTIRDWGDEILELVKAGSEAR